VTSKPDFKVMVLLLVFMQLTRDLFAIAKFLFSLGAAFLSLAPSNTIGYYATAWQLGYKKILF